MSFCFMNLHIFISPSSRSWHPYLLFYYDIVTVSLSRTVYYVTTCSWGCLFLCKKIKTTRVSHIVLFISFLIAYVLCFLISFVQSTFVDFFLKLPFAVPLLVLVFLKAMSPVCQNMRDIIIKYGLYYNIELLLLSFILVSLFLLFVINFSKFIPSPTYLFP